MYTSDDIKSALADDELRLFYQPKVCLLRGRVVGAEALVRWCRKDGTIVGPDDFIAVAEAGGVLHDITLKMLDQAVGTLELMREEFSGISLSMNVTPYDLASHHVSGSISGHLETGRLRQQDLQVEITESDVMTRFEHVYDDIVELNKLGVDVLMDDFGVGYSSVDRLSQLPFSSLKIDKGVVSRMIASRQNLNVVKSSISMARELRMTSVAEGVESEGAYNILVANGCEQAQGFWISTPLQLDDYLNFLREQNRYPGSAIGCVHQAILNLVQFRKSLIDVAFCNNWVAGPMLESITDPDVALSPEQTRFGLWYYGPGRVLAEMSEYQALEEPFLAMNAESKELISSVKKGAERSTVNQHLETVDKDMTHLRDGLHKLERRLLGQGTPV